MKINGTNNKFHWLYLTGFFIILALPLFNLPPWFYPPDWGKTIIFRSVMAILMFLFAFQLLYRKNELNLPDIRKNPIGKPSVSNGASKIVWALVGLFLVFLLASIFSVDPYFSFWASPYRGGGFVTFAFYFVFAILSFILLKKEDWKKAWILSILTGVLVSAIGLIQFYGLFNNIFVSVGSRPGSTIGNPIFLGVYLLLLFFPTLSFTIKDPAPEQARYGARKNKYLKIFYIFSLLVFLYTILITGSRAAYFGIIAGVFYFLLFYPKKLKLLKICLGLFLIFIFLVVFYANVHPGYPLGLPKILQNRVTEGIISRLSIKALYSEERFLAWKTVIKEIEDKPILGWGPENLAVGFDKNYNPLITTSPWWDKAHNIFLDIGAQAGILGIIAYLALFVVLFWQLHKNKHKTEHETTQIISHGMQATLVGYLVANFFSFDSFTTYLIFFLIIGYSLHLTSSGTADLTPIATQNNAENISGNQRNNQRKISGKAILNQITKKRKIILGFLIIMLALFLWQYNFLPFQINTQINIANNWADNKKCDSSLSSMEKISSTRTFLDSYLRMEYVNNIKKCASVNQDKDLAYAKKGVELLKEAVKIQPLYTRYWIFLGSFTTIIANNEQNPATKESLIKEANSYFDKAEILSPSHTETLIERAKTDIIAGDYQKMKSEAEKCIVIDPDLKDCYWTKALAEMYLREDDKANNDIKTAIDYGFNINSNIALFQLVNVYDKTEQYDKLANVYEKLIYNDPNIAQYHASLAFTYYKIGQYKKAREQALIFLQLMPEAKDEVDAFLRTLPLK